MGNQKKEYSSWLLTRQRFHIADRRPPAPARDAREIGTILADILQSGSSAEETEPKVIAERWPLIAGEQIAQHTTPVSLQRGVLTVDADHPGWLAEIRRLPKEHLLKKIMSIPGSPDISELRFRLAPSIRTFYKRSSK